MGNCNASVHNAGDEDSEAAIMKVIRLTDGQIFEYARPILVRDLLLAFRGLDVFHASSVRKPLHPDTELSLGEKYYLRPTTCMAEAEAEAEAEPPLEQEQEQEEEEEEEEEEIRKASSRFSEEEEFRGGEGESDNDEHEHGVDPGCAPALGLLRSIPAIVMSLKPRKKKIFFFKDSQPPSATEFIAESPESNIAMGGDPSMMLSFIPYSPGGAWQPSLETIYEDMEFLTFSSFLLNEEP